MILTSKIFGIDPTAARLQNRILSSQSSVLERWKASPKLMIARRGEPSQAASQRRGDSNLPTPCLSRGVHLTTRSLPIKRLQKAAEKKATSPPCVRVRASASQKGDGARSDRQREREREREKKEATRDSHCVHTCVYVYVHIGVCRCMCREGYFFEKPLDERETHLDRGSVLPGHRKLSRAAHLARERERKRVCIRVCMCVGRGKELKSVEAKGRRERRTRMRKGTREREGQRAAIGWLSRALLNIVAYTRSYRTGRACVSVRAGARKQRVIKGLEGRRSASA